MVIEHTFITTLEAPDALRSASELLAQGGFVAQAQSAFTLGPATWNAIEMQRGKKVRAAKTLMELPQIVRIEWDRGRVSLAASVSQYQYWSTGWGYGLVGSGARLSATKKGKRLQADLLFAIARSVEFLLANKLAPEQANQAWMQIEEQLKLEAKKARRRRIISLIVLALFVAFCVAMVTMAARG